MEVAIILGILIIAVLALSINGIDKIERVYSIVKNALKYQLTIEKKMADIESQNAEIKKSLNILLSERELEKARYARIKDIIENEQAKRTST